MKTRLDIINDAINFLESLSSVIDTTNVYDTENFIKLLKSAGNKYLQTLIDFFEDYEEYDIKGSHLIELLTVALEGKKELLEITGDLWNIYKL